MHLSARRLRSAGEAGVVGANLAITLAFALFAVIQLTRTTIAAEQIDDRVEVITSDVGDIDEELVNVPKLDETSRTVKGIRRNLGTLQPVVRSINDGVAAINGRVDRVIGLVAGIKVDLDNVLAQVGTGGPGGHTGPGGKTSPATPTPSTARSPSSTAKAASGNR